MLEKKDKTALQTFTFASFPKLEGRFPIRSFDPPKLPTLPPTDDPNRLEALLELLKTFGEQEQWIKHDVMAQATPKTRSFFEDYFENSTAMNPFGLMEAGNKHAILTSALSDYPYLVLFTHFNSWDSTQDYSGLGYITQFPSDYETPDIAKFIGIENALDRVTDNFGKFMEYFATAQTMAQAIQYESDEYITELNAAFGLAATVQRFGKPALSDLRVFAEAYQDKPGQQLSNFMQECINRLEGMSGRACSRLTGTEAIELGESTVLDLHRR